MGAFFDSIHVRTEDSGSLQKALEQIAKEKDIKFLLGPAINGWISIFSSEIGDEAVSRDITTWIQHDIFHLTLHDDDVFYYYFYRNGRLLDRYNSFPDYFEAASEEELRESVGHPELFQDLLPESMALSKLKKLLAADKFTFESERMSDFSKLLGLTNALSSYDYLQEGEHDQVERWELFVQVESQPLLAEDYNKRGEIRLAKNRYDEALFDFDKAIELNPALTVAHENRIRLEDAKAGQNKKRAENYILFARKFKGNGDFENALKHFNKAIELDPASAVAYSSRGILKKSEGDLEGALMDLNKAIELNANLSTAYMSRAGVKNAKGDSVGALADYNKSIELKPDSPTAHNNRGELRRKKGDMDGALEDYNKAIELKPDSAVYYSNRSMVKQIKGDLEGALTDCNRAIELKSDLAPAYNNRGMVKQVAGDLDGALEDYKKAIAIDPNVPAFQANRDKAIKIRENQKH